MSNAVAVVGAGDWVGQRIVKDFIKKGWQVYAVALPGQPTLAPYGAAAYYSADPTDSASLFNAARAIDQPLSMLVVNMDYAFAGGDTDILQRQDYADLIAGYEYNTIGPLRAINAFMPLLEKGEGKRICIVTSPESSNNLCRDKAGFGRHITKAPLNHAMFQLFNGLRPQGYTFRMYGKDTQAGESDAGGFAVEYFTRNRSNEPEDPKHSDENRLVLRDHMGIELPW